MVSEKLDEANKTIASLRKQLTAARAHRSYWHNEFDKLVEEGKVYIEDLIVLEEYRKKQAEELYKDIKVGIITCMMSIGPISLNYDENMETVEVCRKYLGKGVVCIDLAGAENIVPLSDFKPFFDKANEYGLPIICHAGDSQDWTACETAIKDFKALRLGHGHHIYENPELCRYAAKNNIALEICPTSNIQCKTQPSFNQHPAKQLLDMGIPVTINTDNMVMARTTLDNEYEHCLNEMGFTFNDLIQVNINSFEVSFAPKEYKEEMINLLKTYLQ